MTYTQIAFGMLRLGTGKQDSDDKHAWEAGLPIKTPLPPAVAEYLKTVLFPHF